MKSWFARHQSRLNTVEVIEVGGQLVFGTGAAGAAAFAAATGKFLLAVLLALCAIGAFLRIWRLRRIRKKAATH